MRWGPGRTRLPIGIDVGRRHIKAVQCVRSACGRRIAAAVSIPRTGPQPIVDRQEVRHLRQALLQESFKGSDIVLAVPREYLLTGIMELPPRGSGAPVEELARSELSRMHRRPPGSFEMTCWDLPAPARAGEATYVMAAACPHADADALLDVFEAEGFKPRGLEVHVSAVTRACASLLESVNGIAGILDIGWKSARFILLHQHVVVYERLLSKGGLEPLVAGLAGRLKVGVEAAERAVLAVGLKCVDAWEDWSAAAVREVAAAAAAHFDAAIEEMRVPLSYLGNQYPDAAAELLVLVGGGARTPGLEDHLRLRMDYRVRTARPSDLAECPKLLDERHGPALATAIGLSGFDER